MRDPRFAQPGSVTNEERERSETSRVLGSAEERRDLDSVLREWWVEVLAQDSVGEAAVAEKVERLRQKCASLAGAQGTLASHACSAFARPGDGANYRAGAHMLGASAAVALRSDPTGVDRLDRAVHLLSECWTAIEVLMEALNSEPRWPADAELLSQLPSSLDRLVGEGFGRRLPNDILLEEERKARSRGLLAYLWERHDERVDLDLRVSVRLALLARRDWGRVAAVAEDLPVRELREALWWRLHLYEDRDAMLAVLRASSAVFDAEKWTERTVALAALVSAVAHADQLHERARRGGWTTPAAAQAAAEQTALLEQDELPNWFTRVMQEARARPDGRALLLFFTASLVREALRPPMGARLWSSADLAIAAVSQVLDQSPTAAEMKAVARLGLAKDSNGADPVVYLVTGAIFGGDARSHWEWYRALLSENDEDVCWQARTWRRACCYDAIAQRLAELPTPFDEWRSAWRSLFFTDRERARFEGTSQSAFFPSVHLIRVGAALLRIAPTGNGARQLYGELRANIRNVVQNDLRLVSPLPREFAADALDLAPALFGEAWPVCLDLERTVLAPPEVRIYAASVLLEGGAPVAAIEAALEAAPHRLADTVQEAREERDRDDNLRRHCDRILTALRENEAGATVDGSVSPASATGLPRP